PLFSSSPKSYTPLIDKCRRNPDGSPSVFNKVVSFTNFSPVTPSSSFSQKLFCDMLMDEEDNNSNVGDINQSAFSMGPKNLLSVRDNFFISDISHLMSL